MRKTTTITDTVALNRRVALSRLGLAVSAMYVAPALLTLSDALAKGGSGGGGSGGGDSGHGGSGHGGGASHGASHGGGASHGASHSGGATSPSGPSSHSG